MRRGLYEGSLWGRGEFEGGEGGRRGEGVMEEALPATSKLISVLADMYLM
jgi:hypothetical protein